MSLFENYPQYIRDVVAAAKGMSPSVRSRKRKSAIASAVAMLIVGGMVAGGTDAVAYAEVYRAIDAVSSDIGNQVVEVHIEDGADGSSLLSDSPNGLSSIDEAAIAQQIRETITPETIAGAAGSVRSDGVVEVEMTTSEGIPVKVTIERDDEGGYAITRVVAELDAQTAAEKRKRMANPITTDEMRQEHAAALPEFHEAFAYAAGIAADADEEVRIAAYRDRMRVLADELVMAVPAGYSVTEIPATPAVPAQTASADAASASSGDEGSAGGADDAARGKASGSDGSKAASASTDREGKPAEKLEADSVVPYALTMRNGQDESVSVRSENLGAAFSSMNGLDGVERMMGYWKETATSVAEGAGQSISGDGGFSTEVFFDETSGMWGYWGHASFTDGTRDVEYNRVVFVDELADQMITVSYRHDCAAGAGGGMGMERFRGLFMHAPMTESETDAYNSALAADDGMTEGDSDGDEASRDQTVPEPMAFAVEDIRDIDDITAGNKERSGGAAAGARAAAVFDAHARWHYEDHLRSIRIAPGETETDAVRQERELSRQQAEAEQEAAAAADEADAFSVREG